MARQEAAEEARSVGVSLGADAIAALSFLRALGVAGTALVRLVAGMSRKTVREVGAASGAVLVPLDKAL